MTIFTIENGMMTIQRKSCCCMIKFANLQNGFFDNIIRRVRQRTHNECSRQQRYA